MDETSNSPTVFQNDTSNSKIIHRFKELSEFENTLEQMAEGLDESSNLNPPPFDGSNPDLEKLFETLADWEQQLKHAKIDLRGPRL